MPSLISGYEYDIFISYRHKDNKSDGWVTEFVRTLRSELEATFKEDISIYFDENPHDGLLQHHEVDDSLREKLRCLVLIPIVSQTYCDPKSFAWQHELLAFIKLASEDKLGLKTKVGGGNTASRVLPVRIHEVDAQDKKLFEEVTGGIMRPIDFIYKESGVNRPLRPGDDRSQNQVRTDYRNQVNKVANAIKDIIAGLQGKEFTSGPEVSSENEVHATVHSEKRQRKDWKFKVPSLSEPAGLRIGLIVSLLAFLALAIFHFSQPPPDLQTYRATIPAPPKTSYASSLGGHMALSPDGRHMAFVAIDSLGKSQLWVRPLNALIGQPLNGTEGAAFPFWSPDSRFIGFFADGKVKKIEAAGGPPQTLCNAPAGRGGTWNNKGTIVFCPSNGFSSLSRVSAAGGLPVTITQLDSSLHQASHRWPYFLPDGEHFLYATRTTAGFVGRVDAIFLASLDTSFIPRVLVNSGSSVAYANGHLLFGREQTLMAQPFDAKSLQTSGDAFPIAERAYIHSGTGKTSFSVSQNGVLAFQTETSSVGIKLLWYDRMGKQTSAIDQSAVYNHLRLSPDGKRIATTQFDVKGRNDDVWLYEISRAVWTRFTFDPASERWPIWSPDGSTIVFASDRKKLLDLFQRASSGAGSEEPLLDSSFPKYPNDWSRDGRFIAYTHDEPKTRGDIWILPMDPDPKGAGGERKPFLFLQTEFNENRATFSTDGRWIAYQSDESGRNEVYIRPFPGPGGKWQVSTNGGSHPRWRRDGKELFYLLDNLIMAADIELDATTVKVRGVTPLINFIPYVGVNGDIYDVTGDGKRFLLASQRGAEISSPVTLVVNWVGEIKK